MFARYPRLAAAALAVTVLALAACGGGEGAEGPATGEPAATSAPADTGLNPSVTVDTQATPGDTAERLP